MEMMSQGPQRPPPPPQRSSHNGCSGIGVPNVEGSGAGVLG